jgi:hypothetical protein
MAGGKARLPPRWFVVTFSHVHRRIVRASGGRKGLWPPRPGSDDPHEAPRQLPDPGELFPPVSPLEGDLERSIPVPAPGRGAYRDPVGDRDRARAGTAVRRSQPGLPAR